MYDSATRLKRLVRSYVHHRPEYVIGKFVPLGTTGVTDRAQDYTVAYSAQELLEHLPCFVKDIVSDTVGRQVTLCLRRILLHYLRRHAQRVGGALANDAGRRGDFVVWVVLSVYADMAAVTEARWHSEGGSNEAAVYSRSTRRRQESLYAYCDERLRQHQGSPWELLEQADYLAGASGAMWGWPQRNMTPYLADRHIVERFMRTYVVPVIAQCGRCSAATLQRSMTMKACEDGDMNDGTVCDKQPCLALDVCVSQARRSFSFDALSPGFSALHIAAAALHATGTLLCAVRKDLASHDERDVLLYAAGHHRVPSVVDEREDAVRAERARLAHALAVATHAVQLAPTLLEANEETHELGDSEVCSAESRSTSTADESSTESDTNMTEHGGSCYGSVYGSWPTVSGEPAMLSPHGVRYRLLHTRRLSLLLPGLLFAATECFAVIDVGGREARAAPWTPDAMVTAGTCFITPPCARPALLLGEGEMRDCAIDPACTTALYVTPSHLRPAALLLLFSTFPCYDEDGEAMGTTTGCPDDGATPDVAGWRALARAVRQVQAGLVVLVCAGQVGTRERRGVEGWGTTSRGVVLLQCVGAAGLAQLALQFDCVPNRACTRLPHLRAPPAGATGLLLYALDELLLPRHGANAGCQHEERQGGTTHPPLYERRVRLVAVIGHCACECSDRDSLSHNTSRCTTTTDGAGAAAMQSMYGTRNESSSSSDGEGDGEARSMPRASRLLPAPRVLIGVVVGGASATLQKEWLHAFRIVHRHLLHLLLLPALTRDLSMACSLPVVADGGASVTETSVIARLDRLHASPVLTRHTTTASAYCGAHDTAFADSPSGTSTATDDFLHRVRHSLREALWTYELLSLQQQESSCSIEQAWQTLACATQSVTGGCTCEDVTTHAACSTHESVFEATEAYLSIGRCLDTLFRTPLCLTQSPSSQAAEQSSDTPVILPPVE